MTVDRRRELGTRGESIAVRHLVGRGYSILDRNYRTRYGELDLVASCARYLVFCEVKTRVGEGPAPGPLSAVGRRKQRQIRSMARQWLSDRRRHGARGPAQIRFDAIGVTLGRNGQLLRLQHLEGAF
jgi:putative endonuclease